MSVELFQQMIARNPDKAEQIKPALERFRLVASWLPNGRADPVLGDARHPRGRRRSGPVGTKRSEIDAVPLIRRSRIASLVHGPDGCGNSRTAPRRPLAGAVRELPQPSGPCVRRRGLSDSDGSAVLHQLDLAALGADQVLSVFVSVHAGGVHLPERGVCPTIGQPRRDQAEAFQGRLDLLGLIGIARDHLLKGFHAHVDLIGGRP